LDFAAAKSAVDAGSAPALISIGFSYALFITTLHIAQEANIAWARETRIAAQVVAGRLQPSLDGFNFG